MVRNFCDCIFLYCNPPVMSRPQEEIEAKLAAVKRVKSRYAWSGLYATPQLSDGEGRPDAVATLMAILHQRALRHEAMGVQRGGPPLSLTKKARAGTFKRSVPFPPREPAAVHV